MDKGTLLNSLAGTLDSNVSVRKDSEAQLELFASQAGFTTYLLELIVEPNVPLGVQISAAIYFKNRVVNYWTLPANKSASPLFIPEHEKPLVKERIIETLIKIQKNEQIRLQLSTAIHNIIASEKWEGLIDVVKSLFQGSQYEVYTGLICLYEYTKNYRWSGLERANSSNPVLEEVTQETFPILEDLMSRLLNSDDDENDKMLYLIVKIFKFTTFSSLPTYFQDFSKLGTWCHLQILLINKPLSASLLNEVSENRSSYPRIRAVKWCFGNLHRLLSRHGGGFSTRDKESNHFAKHFMENFVPEILNAYWKIIEKWSTKEVWLSEGSIYHMISFMEQLIDTQGWDLLSDKLDAILRHVILPTLSANESTVELYEDEPDEYIRRYFDINRENNTSDVASINFIFRLSTKKFGSTSNEILGIVNEIFTRRASDRNDLQAAKEVEGALRILSTISYKLDKKSSPLHGQIDQLLHTYVYPELLEESVKSTPWLSARACDTIAMFVYKYQDQKVLQAIFQGVVTCFQNDDQLPLQLTAVDALRTLIAEDIVAQHIADQVPQLMGKLLEMSKKIDSDILTSVMDSFVEKFASNLEPYALELSTRLVEQFLNIASELLDQFNDVSNAQVDKEYQASGILNSLTTLVISMNSSPDVTLSLEPVIKDMVKFIFENAMIAFLVEGVEILESILFSVQRVTPAMWEMFHVCIESFDTYAYEYFDTFIPFFENIVNFGFTGDAITINSPQAQSLITICFNVLRSDPLEPVFAHNALEIIELSILALRERFIPFLPTFLSEIFEVFINLEGQDAFDGYMLHHLSILRVHFSAFYIDAGTTMAFLREKQFLRSFYDLWIEHSEDFQSVYGCKLQILASLSILNDHHAVPEEFIGETVGLLLGNLAALPSAIKAKNDILSQENGLRQLSNSNDDDDDDDAFNEALFDEADIEADEAELEALKQTPLDDTNVFQVFANFFVVLQHQNPSKYQVLFGDLDQKKQELVSQIIDITQESRQEGN